MIGAFTKCLAKRVMGVLSNVPSVEDWHLQEIFQHESYRQASEDVQCRMKLQSSRFTYEYERDVGCFFERYFPIIAGSELRGKTILDLGSFTGGRLVYWVERYGCELGRGIDVDAVYAEAGNLYARARGVNAKFDTGYGECLPYDRDYFDFIVTYDVIEHVQSVEQVMRECYRTLKPGGKLLAVFPPYYQPLEAHLRLATKMPALHLFFSGGTLTAAYYEILKERGPEAGWYARDSRELAFWEKSPFLNGTTVRKFRQIIQANDGWSILHWGVNSIVSHGRRARKTPYRLLALVLVVPARLPIFEEVFLGRVCCALEKRGDGERCRSMEASFRKRALRLQL